MICGCDLIDVFFNVSGNIRSNEEAAAAHQLDAAFSVLPGQPFVQPCSKVRLSKMLGLTLFTSLRGFTLHPRNSCLGITEKEVLEKLIASNTNTDSRRHFCQIIL